MPPGRPALFLDRDGTLVEDAGLVADDDQGEAAPRQPDERVRGAGQQPYPARVARVDGVLDKGAVAVEEQGGPAGRHHHSPRKVCSMRRTMSVVETPGENARKAIRPP